MKKYSNYKSELQDSNKGRLKYFSLIIGFICVPNIVIIDHIIMDLSIPLNKYLYYSHYLIAAISFPIFVLSKYLKTPKQISNVTFVFILAISLIETIVAGWLDQIAGRGSYLYVATILVFSLTFYLGFVRIIILLGIVHTVFILLTLRFQTDFNLLLGDIGNGSVFVLIAFVMQLVVFNQKIREIIKSKAVIAYVEKENMKKDKKAVARKYKKSPLTDEERENIFRKLDQVFETEKPFLKKEISILQVAEMIGTNSAYLSQTINTCFKKNFNSFINEYRIKEAVKLMNHELGKAMSVEGIASHVGFNSKSAFYSAFKQCHGKTPMEYFKSSDL